MPISAAPVAGAGFPFASTAALAAHEADTTSIHGITDTSKLVLKTGENVLTDTAGATESIFDLNHYGDGSGTSQSYGMEIHNYDGAKAAFVVHSYSDAQAPVWIDQCRSGALLTMRNTENATYANGYFGAGDFLDLWGGSAGTTERFGRLTKDLVFVSSKAGKPWTFQPSVASIAVSVNQTQAANAVYITTSTAYQSLVISHSGASIGVDITANAGAAGFYPLRVNGYDYGPQVKTSQNSGVTFTVTKDGTGSGTAQQVVNKGTGLSLDVRNASASLFAIDYEGIPNWVTASTQQTTVGAAGAASALPATPSKYLKVRDSTGTTYVVPCYAAS